MASGFTLVKRAPKYQGRVRTHWQKEIRMSKLGLIKELWDFLKVRKRFWLAPIIIIFIILSILVIFVQSSAVVPFIYSLF
jgi:hypothetical protein